MKLHDTNYTPEVLSDFLKEIVLLSNSRTRAKQADIESASFISYIQGDTRQARFGCLGLAVHVGARAPSS